MVGGLHTGKGVRGAITGNTMKIKKGDKLRCIAARGECGLVLGGTYHAQEDEFVVFLEDRPYVTVASGYKKIVCHARRFEKINENPNI